MLGPSAPQRCTPDLFVGAHELAQRYHLEIHTHILETVTQRVHSDRDYNGSFISYLDSLGVLSPNLTIAHGCWLEGDEIDLLAERQCSVVHNPLSNMKLGSGIIPWRDLLDSGVNVALGTDGVCSSDTQRLSEVMKAAALIHKTTSFEIESWPTAEEVLLAATVNGANSAMLGRDIGSIEVGKKADLLFYDLNSLSFLPEGDLEKQLVYSENGSSLEKVMVDGKFVVEDHKLTSINELDLLGEVRRLNPFIKEWRSRAMERHAKYLPAFRDQYEKSVGILNYK